MESDGLTLELQNGTHNYRLPRALVVFEALIALFALGLTSYAGEISGISHASAYLLAIHVGICVLALWIRTEFKMLCQKQESEDALQNGSKMKLVINVLMAVTFISAVTTLIQA